MEIGRIVSLAAQWFLGPVGSGSVPLGPGIGATVVVSPVILCMSALLRDQLSLGGIGVQIVVEQGQLCDTDKNLKDHVLQGFCNSDYSVSTGNLNIRPVTDETSKDSNSP